MSRADRRGDSRSTNGECLITADHGNVEQMSDATTGQAHTAHTSEPVPLVYIGDRQLRFRERRHARRRRADAADAAAVTGTEGDDRPIADRSARARASPRVAQQLDMDVECGGARRSLVWVWHGSRWHRSPAGAAEDISKARRDINGITKRLNDLDVWFSDASRRQRDLQKELRSTDQSIAATNGDIRQIESRAETHHDGADRTRRAA